MFPKNINYIYLKYLSPYRISHPISNGTNGLSALGLQVFGHISDFDHRNVISITIVSFAKVY